MPRLTFRHCVISAIAIASLQLGATPVFAADPVEYVPPVQHHVLRKHPVHKRVHVARRHKVRLVQTSYRELNCGELLIEYRPPYQPHTEIVRICRRDML